MTRDPRPRYSTPEHTNTRTPPEPQEDITQRDLYDRPPLVLKGWAKGPVAVLGDAAHPMMPNLGQGGCQAVEDGYRLAQELSKIKDRGDVAWALRMYENSRLVRSSAVHGLARIASDILFQSRLLFQNRIIGSFVGLMMTVSMPAILEFLYQVSVYLLGRGTKGIR